MTPQRVFTLTHLLITAAWGLACFAGALAMTSALPLFAKIGIAAAVWLSVVALPLVIRGRMEKLDELQQLTFWRNLGAGGLWIMAFLPVMAAYTLLTGGNELRGLIALVFMAPALMMGFAIGITMMAENAMLKEEPAE